MRQGSAFLYQAQPVLVLVASVLATAAVVFSTEWLAMPAAARKEHTPKRSNMRKVADAALVIPFILYIFAFFFVISWRPVYAFLGTISFFLIFTAISRAKYTFIREPLIFSDLALVLDVFKYKEIFYAGWLNIVFWLIAFSYVFGVSALVMYLEPDLLPQRHGLWLATACIAGWITIPLLLLIRQVRESLAILIRRWIGRVNLRINTVRFGTFAYIGLTFIMWCGKKRETFLDTLTHRLNLVAHDILGAEESNAPLVVVWQSESFIDMRRFGVAGLELPILDKLRGRAAVWGLLGNVFEGGYTLRTEFAVLSGLKPEAIGLDASYPYLRAARFAPVTWPSRLKRSGWSTHFVHPYDRTFFLRHRAMPQLGFDRMTMLDAFEHVPSPIAPYVSDSALTEEVIEMCRQAPLDRGAFIFVASMENHGPWNPQRSNRFTDPVDIYCSILQRSDSALGRLASVMDTLQRPAWLVFYGDHAPLLKSFADPFPDPRTDFVIVPFGKAAEATAPRCEDIEPWDMLERLAMEAGILVADQEYDAEGPALRAAAGG